MEENENKEVIDKLIFALDKLEDTAKTEERKKELNSIKEELIAKKNKQYNE